MTKSVWWSLLLLTTNAHVAAADVAAFSCDMQYQTTRTHVLKATTSSIVAKEEDPHIPLYGDFFPDIGISVILGSRGNSAGFLEVRSANYPQFSISTKLGSLPLRHGFVLSIPGGGYDFLYATTSDNESEQFRIIGPLGSQHTEERPVVSTATLPLSQIVNRGSTIQQSMATVLAVTPADSRQHFVLEWGKTTYKTDLAIPKFIIGALDSNTIELPVMLCARSSDFSLFGMRMKDGRRIILADDRKDHSTHTYDIEPPYKVGALRLIRSWVYLQDDKLRETTAEQAARTKFSHRLWRPSDDKRIDFQATGDFELLDISDGATPEALVRVGNKLMAGRFDEKQGPIPTRDIPLQNASPSFHWAYFLK